MGAPKVKTYGGGSAKPPSDSFNSFLNGNVLDGGFAKMLQSLNSKPEQMSSAVDMNDPQFAAMSQYLNKNKMNDVANMRERYTGPGARGTVGAIGEASYRADANSQNVLAMGQIQNMLRGQNFQDNQLNSQNMMGAMGIQGNAFANMMGAYNNASQIANPQAQLMGQPSGFSQFLGAASAIAPYALAPFTGGASLGLGGMFGQQGKVNRANGNYQADGAMNPGWTPQWNPRPR